MNIEYKYGLPRGNVGNTDNDCIIQLRNIFFSQQMALINEIHMNEPSPLSSASFFLLRQLIQNAAKSILSFIFFYNTLQTHIIFVISNEIVFLFIYS